jgi:short-subunit dehydrogenase
MKTMKYALVTGAAKGIGKAIAAELAARNYNLLLVDIDGKGLVDTEEEINRTFNNSIHILQLDLSNPDCAEIIKQWSKRYHQYLDVVVNNAGYGLNGPFEQISIDEQLNIIDVNVKAQLKICHAFIPLLKQFPKAWLLNVGSTTCYQSVPYLAIYAASKALVISFTRSLRYELRNSGISVSCLSPGSTDTNFVDRARMGNSIRKTAKKYNMTAAEVAKIAVKKLFKGKAEIIPGFTNKLNAFLPKFFPKTFVEKIAANIYEPKESEHSKVEALA